MRDIVCLIGASGVGKTTVARHLATRSPWAGQTFYFDHIGVPSAETMEREFGGGEAWQKWATFRWIADLAERRPAIQLLEGQTRPSYIAEAAARYHDVRIHPVLLDCRREVRHHRLAFERNQPELATARMQEWAAYLRGQADALGLPVIDTSDLPVEKVAASVESLFRWDDVPTTP
ncbi:MAG: hypothetical protein KC729_02035 [Candidatus Eisenbacteria bacterium]|uniref:Uncharacterized protein n=1 Tax=Eiseniibacteriota bacterium TaxID=2212470 RepID=A0A956RMH0_UNCEI|nr:hypothetical protein [Candidatus Eisenbacteria bacterium]